MRAIVCLILLGGAAVADPKGVPAKFAKAAGDAFGKAQAADAKGDLGEAVRQYQRANAIAPHPNTYFNLADVQRRAKHYEDAADAYAKYLELAPDAADRKAVEKLIGELRAMPATLVVELEEPDGQVFVDGLHVGAAPVTATDVPKGTHQVDVVTPITFGDMPCAVGAGGKRTCRVHARPRVDGNVVLSGSRTMGRRSWPIGDQRFHLHGRFALRPGHYDLVKVVDRQCAPLPLDVPDGEDIVTYAYVTYPDPRPPRNACIELKIAQQQVRFAPTK
jgi:tetratricopeptide (TPR) repeat protein